jgi:hypothetical protein
MSPSAFHAFYDTALQQVLLPGVVPVVFVGAVLLSAGRRARLFDPDPAIRFVARYTLAFAVESIVDVLATGPLSRWLGIADRPAGTAVLLFFVLLGDFRVFFLLFRFAEPRRPLSRAAARASRWTLLVPLTAWTIDALLRLFQPELPEQTIWLVYEIAFLVLALWMRARALDAWLPRGEPHRDGLRAIVAYAASYYGLWVVADVLILVFGLDLGWGLRVVPNLLYYGFYAPFVDSQLLAER